MYFYAIFIYLYSLISNYMGFLKVSVNYVLIKVKYRVKVLKCHV